MFWFLVACTLVGTLCGGLVGGLVGLLVAASVPYVLAFIDSIVSR
jgi:hypothetical protein